MSELRKVSHAEHSPGVCTRCTTHKGPFVDLGVTALEGQLYLCETCIVGIARVAGLPDNEELARVEALLADANEQIDEMKATLAESRRTLVADFHEFVREREGKREPAPEPAPEPVEAA